MEHEIWWFKFFFINKSIRGILGAILIISVNSGMLLGYIIGDIVSWDMQPLIFLVISYIFLGGIFIVHDSPYYLLQKSRFQVRTKCSSTHSIWIIIIIIPLQHAENALKFFRGCSSGKEMSQRVRQELENLMCLIKISNGNSSNGKITLKSFCEASLNSNSRTFDTISFCLSFQSLLHSTNRF